jgi:hypothetical protein
MRTAADPWFTEVLRRGLVDRLWFKSRGRFHECPKCKSRSVWRAAPHGTVEEALSRLLKLSAYRCARCDRRFLDSKVSSDAPEDISTTRRCVAYVRSKASRLLKLTQRTPFEDSFNLSIFAHKATDKRNSPSLQDSM